MNTINLKISTNELWWDYTGLKENSANIMERNKVLKSS